MFLKGTCSVKSLIYFNTLFTVRVRFLGMKWENHRFGKIFVFLLFFEEKGHQKEERKGTEEDREAPNNNYYLWSTYSARHCAKSFANTISFNLPRSPLHYNYHPHLIDREIEVQKSSCPSHRS